MSSLFRHDGVRGNGRGTSGQDTGEPDGQTAEPQEDGERGLQARAGQRRADDSRTPDLASRMVSELQKRLRLQDSATRLVVETLFAGGHLLLDDVPGV